MTDALPPALYALYVKCEHEEDYRELHWCDGYRPLRSDEMIDMDEKAVYPTIFGEDLDGWFIPRRVLDRD